MNTRTTGIIIGAIGALGLAAFIYLRLSSGPSAEQVVEPIRAAVAAAKQTDPPRLLVLAEVTDFTWDEVYVFGPYTPIERINEVLNRSDGPSALAQIHERDDIVLLVFRHEGRVLVRVPFARSDADFAASSRLEPIAAAAARFELIPLASDPDWVNLSLTQG